jgi:hypothetical protein
LALGFEQRSLLTLNPLQGTPHRIRLTAKCFQGGACSEVFTSLIGPAKAIQR